MYKLGGQTVRLGRDFGLMFVVGSKPCSSRRSNLQLRDPVDLETLGASHRPAAPRLEAQQVGVVVRWASAFGFSQVADGLGLHEPVSRTLVLEG